MTLTPVRLTLLTGAAALGSLWLLVPDMAERLSSLARDGRVGTAVELGHGALETANPSPDVLARVFDINSREGDPEQARTAILEYLRQRPDDVAMLWRAVEFLEEGEDLAGLKDALRMLVERADDPAAREKLARLYRLYGDFESERALLLNADPARLTPDMAWRAAGLLAREGDFTRSAAFVRRLDDAPGGLDAEGRGLAFDILLNARQTQEAGERAARWASNGLLPAQRSLFVLQLALAGDDGAALALATEPGGQAMDSPSLAWTLGTRGHVQLAETILDRLAAESDPAVLRRVAQLYVDLAIRTGTVGRALARTDTALRSPDPARRVEGVRLAATLFDRQGYGAIAPLRPLLTGDALASEPLFAASLLMAERNPMAARVFLSRADLRNADEDDARLWSAMASEILGPAATLDALTARWRTDALSPAMLARLGEASLRAGRFDPAWAILHGPHHPAPNLREPAA